MINGKAVSTARINDRGQRNLSDGLARTRSGSYRGTSGTVLLAFLIASAALAWYLLAAPYYFYLADLALLAAVGTIALNLLTGYAGQVSIGNAAFMAVGGYTLAFVVHAPFPLAIIIAGVTSGAVGLVIGLTSFRVRGLYLIFSTLALQYIVVAVLTAYDSRVNAVGGHIIAAPRILGMTISTDKDWYIVIVIFWVLILMSSLSMAHGRLGREWRAIQASESAAAIAGIKVRQGKLTAFMVSSAIIGMQGALLGYLSQVVTYDYYTFDVAVMYIASMVIGGTGSIGGSTAGAVVVTAVPFLLTNYSPNVAFIRNNLAAIDLGVFALLILAFLLWAPDGIAGVFRRGIGAWRRSGIRASRGVEYRARETYVGHPEGAAASVKDAPNRRGSDNA